MIQSICRIILVTFVVLMWLTPLLPRLAKATDYSKPRPVPTVVQAAPSNDRDQRLENALGAAAASGLLTTALRDQPHGALWAVGGTVVGAAVIEAAHSGSFKGSNVWWAVGGAAVGSVGVCQLYFRKNLVGCAVPFK